MSFLPAELIVGVLAMLPVTELRVAIPVGVLMYHMPLWEAFLIAEIGNAAPVFVVYALGDYLREKAEKKKSIWHRLLHKVMHRSHRKVHNAIQRWGPFALALFVAVPLPGTGVWNAAIGAYLLHIKLPKSLPYILLGNLVAGLIIVLALSGAVAAFRWFLPLHL